MKSQTFTAHEGMHMNLGERAFWLFLCERLSASAGFLVAAALISLLRAGSLVPPGFVRYAAFASIICWMGFFVSLAYAFVAARLEYRNNSFSFDADAFKIRSGIFTKFEMAIPYRQIQNVEIERTVAQQLSGVSKVVIITAGTDNPATPRDESSAVMPVIDRDIAVGLQNELLRRAARDRISGN